MLPIYIPSEDNPADHPSRGKRRRPCTRKVLKMSVFSKPGRRLHRAVKRQEHEAAFIRECRLDCCSDDAPEAGSSLSLRQMRLPPKHMFHLLTSSHWSSHCSFAIGPGASLRESNALHDVLVLRGSCARLYLLTIFFWRSLIAFGCDDVACLFSHGHGFSGQVYRTIGGSLASLCAMSLCASHRTMLHVFIFCGRTILLSLAKPC